MNELKLAKLKRKITERRRKIEECLDSRNACKFIKLQFSFFMEKKTFFFINNLVIKSDNSENYVHELLEKRLIDLYIINFIHNYDGDLPMESKSIKTYLDTHLQKSISILLVNSLLFELHLLRIIT